METRNYRELKNEPCSTTMEDFDLHPSATEEKAGNPKNEKTEGRACSVIPGTVCEGMIQGTFIEKFEECKSCEFYQEIKEKEENNFIPAITAIKKRK